MKIIFDIDQPGERAAGILSFTDTIVVFIESGDPGGNDGEFAEHLAQSLREWYDGAEITIREEK